MLHTSLPLTYVPDFFLVSILEEGYTGVSLFMTLSGYLFARLVFDKTIIYSAFLWNRFVRLAPLLAVIFLYAAIFDGFTLWEFVRGFVGPNWPNGGWSITTELHFYIIFPLIVVLTRRYGFSAFALGFVLSLAARTALWLTLGEVQSFAYWTIMGRFDQFALGMAFFHLSKSSILDKNADAVFWISAISFLLFWHAFNAAGGFAGYPSYPSPRPLWIILPTIEGLAYGCMIAAYDKCRYGLTGPVARATQFIGMISYSIYLWHTSIIELVAPLTFRGEDMVTASLNALFVFPMIVGFSYLSYRWIETPFIQFRVPYLTPMTHLQSTHDGQPAKTPSVANADNS